MGGAQSELKSISLAFQHFMDVINGRNLFILDKGCITSIRAFISRRNCLPFQIIRREFTVLLVNKSPLRPVFHKYKSQVFILQEYTFWLVRTNYKKLMIEDQEVVKCQEMLFPLYQIEVKWAKINKTKWFRKLNALRMRLYFHNIERITFVIYIHVPNRHTRLSQKNAGRIFFSDK